MSNVVSFNTTLPLLRLLSEPKTHAAACYLHPESSPCFEPLRFKIQVRTNVNVLVCVMIMMIAMIIVVIIPTRQTIMPWSMIMIITYHLMIIDNIPSADLNQTNIPIITCLCNPGLRGRHWKQVGPLEHVFTQE